MTNDIIVWYCNIAFKIQQTKLTDRLTKGLKETYEEVFMHLGQKITL